MRISHAEIASKGIFASKTYLSCQMQDKSDTPQYFLSRSKNCIAKEKVGPRKTMRSAGQSVQKYIHATVGPERVYTPQTKIFNVRPCLL